MPSASSLPTASFPRSHVFEDQAPHSLALRPVRSIAGFHVSHLETPACIGVLTSVSWTPAQHGQHPGGPPLPPRSLYIHMTLTHGLIPLLPPTVTTPSRPYKPLVPPGWRIQPKLYQFKRSISSETTLGSELAARLDGGGGWELP